MLLRRTFAHNVEFIGGPYDGLVKAIQAPLRAFVALRTPTDGPMKSLKRLLLNLLRLAPTVLIRMSIYELHRDGSRLSYRYCGTQALRRGELTSKRGLGTLDQPSCGV